MDTETQKAKDSIDFFVIEIKWDIEITKKLKNT
jgi:hypothetical protein